MKKMLPVLVVLLVVLVAAGILYKGKSNDAPRDFFYSGVVESKTYNLAFETPGTVSEVAVDEGDRVTVGQIVARLDSRELEQRLVAAQAQVSSAKAQLESLQKGTRYEDIAAAQARVDEAAAELARLRNGVTDEELAQAFHQKEAALQQARLKEHGYREEDREQAKARLQQAKAELVAARQDNERYQKLFVEGAAPEAVAEEKRRRYESAQAVVRERTEALDELRNGFRSEEIATAQEQYKTALAHYQDLANGTRPELIEAAQARFEQASAALEKARNGARVEDVKAASDMVKAAQAEVERLRVALEKTELKSPVEGVVSSRAFEPGESVGVGTAILQLTAADRTWVNIFVPEADIGTLHLGMKCSITRDAESAGSIPGSITFISPTAEFTPRFVQTERERVLLVYRVEVTVEDSEGVLKPGLPADVQVETP